MAALGTLSTQLPDIIFKLDQMAGNQNILKDYQPQIAGLRLIQQNQTAALNAVTAALARNDKDYYNGKVKVNWLTGISGIEEAVEPNCDLTGDPLAADEKEYSLGMDFKKDFSIDQDLAKTHTYEVQEQEAKGMMELFRIMDEAYAKRSIAKLDSFTGTNLYTGGYTADATSGNLLIPAADYNVTFFAYLAKAAIFNRLNNYYIIDNGENLFTPKFLADAGQVTNGLTQANIYNQFRIDFDFINFAKAGIDTDTLLVDTNSIFFATRTRFGNRVPEARPDSLFTSVVTSPFTGINYDLYVQDKCEVVNGESHYVRVYRLQTKGDLLQAPEMTYASVLGFQKAPAV